MKLVIPPRIVRILSIIIVCLILANLCTIVIRFAFDEGPIQKLVPLFRLDEEENFPTLFSTLQLLACAGLLCLIGFSRRAQGSRDGGYWLFLAGVFVFLGIDEFVTIHERVQAVIQEVLGTSGVLFFAWVIPYGLAVLVVGLIYLRFVWRLPTRVRTLIFLAGGLYVGGALVMEIIGRSYLDLHNGQGGVIYALVTTLEETLELVGITVFIYTLLIYISTVLGGIDLQIAPSVTEKAPSQAHQANQPTPQEVMHGALEH